MNPIGQTEEVQMTEPRAVRLLLIFIAFVFLGIFLLLPLTSVFVEAFKKGWQLYVSAITEPVAVAAIKLTLITAAIAVTSNMIFGIAAAWAISKFDFCLTRGLSCYHFGSYCGP